MGQLEDFRASLKRKDSAVSSEGEIPVKNVSKAKQEKMKRRTLGVSGELHLELKALSDFRKLSWVQCDLTKRIRRSHIVATETSWI